MHALNFRRGLLSNTLYFINFAMFKHRFYRRDHFCWSVTLVYFIASSRSRTPGESDWIINKVVILRARTNKYCADCKFYLLGTGISMQRVAPGHPVGQHICSCGQAAGQIGQFTGRMG